MKKLILTTATVVALATTLSANNAKNIDWTKRAADSCMTAFQINDVLNHYHKFYCSNSENDSAMRVEVSKATNEAMTAKFGKISNSSLKNLGLGISTEKDLSTFTMNYQKFICEIKDDRKALFNFLTFTEGRKHEDYKKFKENRLWMIEDAVHSINTDARKKTFAQSSYFVERFMLSDFYMKEDSISKDKELKQFVKAIFYNDIEKAKKIGTKYRDLTNDYISYCRSNIEKMKNRGK